MFSSGMKRGLASGAVSALAVAGLPMLASSAGAVTHASTLGADAVDLVQPGTDVSAKNDGQNTTMRLTALGGSNVTSVTFAYRIGAAGPWVEIGTAQRDDQGAFGLEWNPSSIAGATDVTLRATGNGPAAKPTDDSAAVAVDNNLDTVNVDEGDALDVFQAPYTNDAAKGQFGVLTGTSSAPGATPALDFYDPSAKAWHGSSDATTSTTAKGAATGTWRGVLDITDYDYASGGTDELLVKATGATDDAESFAVNRQKIDAVSAEPTSANVPGSGKADITITVTDADGDPVAGAEVRREGGAYVGQSDADGKVTTQQDGGTEAYYYANATDSDSYEPGLGDKKTQDVTVGQYAAGADSLEAVSVHGDAFDVDEHDDLDDIQVKVKDQEGEDFATTQVVKYSWSFTAFDGDPKSKDLTDPDGTTAAVAGTASIPFPEQAEGGTYTLTASLEADPATGQGAVAASEVLTVKAGESSVVFADDQESAPAGSATEVAGRLVLADGTGLPGRPITLTYTGGDAGFDQENGADAKTRSVRTGDDGGFSVTLDDVEQDDQSTETGKVEAKTDDYEDPNTAGDSDNPGASGEVAVTFFNETAPDGAEVEVSGLSGTGTPGAPQYGTALVTDKDGNPVENVAVTLSVDGASFFTSGPQNGAAGQEAGDLADSGQEITRVTDADGKVSFAVGIERSEEFDGNGKAADQLAAAVGDATDTESVSWSTADPLNGGEVLIEMAGASYQESGVLPKAPVTDDVAYDVKVTDQFGNPVGGEDVAVSADGGDVVNGAGNEIDSVQPGFSDAPELYLSSDEASEATPSGSWTTDSSVYAADGADADDDADVVTTADSETVTGDGPVTSFYEVDFAASSFELGQLGDEQREVGETVIMTYEAADQNGEPIEFDVSFFRTGPGDDSDGDANKTAPTGEDGSATYVFSGSQEGTAKLSALGYLDNEVVPESRATDTVTFGQLDDGDPSDPIEIVIAGDSNGSKKDVVRASVDENAAGETIKLFKIRGKKKDGNKRLKQIRQDIVTEDGQLTFKVADRNGNRKTRFIAKVTRGGNTNKSNTQKIR